MYPAPRGWGAKDRKPVVVSAGPQPKHPHAKKPGNKLFTEPCREREESQRVRRCRRRLLQVHSLVRTSRPTASRLIQQPRRSSFGWTELGLVGRPRLGTRESPRSTNCRPRAGRYRQVSATGLLSCCSVSFLAAPNDAASHIHAQIGACFK